MHITVRLKYFKEYLPLLPRFASQTLHGHDPSTDLPRGHGPTKVRIRHQPNRGRLLGEQDEVKFVMMLRSLLGIAALFLAVNFNAVGQAEVNVAISSVGGRYFDGRVEIPVPAFGQDDPRWSDVRLGPSTDTLGDEGCAVTSAAMVAAFYGIKTDPQQLNAFLTRTGGFTGDGLIHWSRVPSIAPAHLELAYNGGPSYELIDRPTLLCSTGVVTSVRNSASVGQAHFYIIRSVARLLVVRLSRAIEIL